MIDLTRRDLLPRNALVFPILASSRIVGKQEVIRLFPVSPSLETDSLHTMISDPFCMVAPHADTFDQQGATKSVR
jgi:hypothetical protein